MSTEQTRIGSRPEQAQLHVGDHVTDKQRRDGLNMVVTGLPPVRCDEYEFKPGTTVADANPTYPSDELVAEVRYVHEGDVYLDRSKYAFPRSRLEKVHSLFDTDGT